MTSAVAEVPTEDLETSEEELIDLSPDLEAYRSMFVEIHAVADIIKVPASKIRYQAGKGNIKSTIGHNRKKLVQIGSTMDCFNQKFKSKVS